MKNLNLVFVLLTIMLFSACKKQTDPVSENIYDIIQRSSHEDLKALSVYDIDAVERSTSPQFDTSDLFGFLAEFGREEQDLIPAWNGFVQGQGCNNTHWDYIGGQCDSVFWLLHDDVVRDDISLWFFSPVSGCGSYDPPCNGGHEVTVRCYLNGAVYERSAVSWALINYPGKPICDLGIFELTPSGLFEAGQPLEFEPFEFLVEPSLRYDLNTDHKVNIEDFFLFLADFGG